LPPENDTPLPQGYEQVLKFQFPKLEEKEVFLLRDAEGNVIARTKEELEKEKKG